MQFCLYPPYIRLLISGIDVLREGKVTVEVGEQREPLLKIKRGEIPFAEATLPKMPSGRAAINDLLVRLRLNDARLAASPFHHY